MWSNLSAIPSTPTQQITSTYVINAWKEATSDLPTVALAVAGLQAAAAILQIIVAMKGTNS